MTTTEHFDRTRHAVSSEEERSERAQAAVRAFRSMQFGLSAYARAITGNKKLTVEIASGPPRTDGKKIYYQPPIALGDRTPHKRTLCDKRDGNKVLLCPACALNEEVLVNIYHEIGHIAGGSFEETSEKAKADAIRKAVEEWGGKHSAQIQRKFDTMPAQIKNQYKGLATLISPYLPYLVNCIEDARVDSAMFRARPGIRTMMEASTLLIFTQGNETPDGIKYWRDAELNAQAAIACYVVACGYQGWQDWLHESIAEAFTDQRLLDLLGGVAEMTAAEQAYEVSFPVLAVLREHGFFQLPEDQEQDDAQGVGDDEEDSESGDQTDSEDSSEEASEGSDEDDGSGGDPDGGSDSSDGDEGEGDGAGDADLDPDSSDESGTGGVEVDDAPAEDSGQSDDDAGGEGSDEAGDHQGEPSSEGDPGDASETGQSNNADDSDGDRSNDEPSEGSSDGPDGSSAGSEGSGESDDESGDSVDGDADPEGSDSSSDEAGSDAEGEGTDGPSSDADDAAEGGSGSVESDDEAADSTDRGQSSGGDQAPDEPSDSDGGEAASDSGDQDAPGDDDGSDGSESDANSGLTGRGQASDDGSAPSDDSEHDPEDEGSGQDLGSEGSEPEQLTDERIDTGADEGEGGVQLPELPPYGDPQDIGTVMESFHKDEAEFVESPEEQEAVAVAIIQGLYFEKPSVNVTGVRVHSYDSEYILPGGKRYDPAWDHDRLTGIFGNNKVRLGIDVDLEVPESILGPALLQTRRVFTDNQTAAHQRNLKSGRINRKVLGNRAWNDDERLFTKKRLPGKRSYAVIIGIDISGSTIGESLALAKRAAWAQAELCARAGIDFAVYAHSAGSATGTWRTDREEALWLDIYEIKTFDEPWDSNRKVRLEELGSDSENLDGHSIEFYRKRLDEHPATDKILLYYTDGKMPAANYDEELEILTREINICRRKKYTLLGVGIRTDSPRKHGLDTVQVNDDADLKAVVMHLEKRLVRR